MAKFDIIYQSHETIQARERGFGEWIEYDAVITIKREIGDRRIIYSNV